MRHRKTFWRTLCGALLVVGATLPACWRAPALAQPSAPTGIETVEVPLVSWVTARQHALANTLADFSESADRLATFRAFADALAAHDWAKVRERASAVSYQIVAIKEADEWFVVASDDSKTGRGPTLVVNTSARRDLVLEAPHVPFEVGTGEQATVLLRDLGGRAAILSGAHRCASRSFGACDGKTAVCGSLEGYRDSDAGHNMATMFHVSHLAFADRWNQSIVVSLHGMREDEAGHTRMIVSNGIRQEDKGEATAATKFRLTLGRSFDPPGTVVDCNYRPDDVFNYRKLCGYTNVQGRHVNGAADACRRSVDTGTGRFVHLEQDWNVLKPYAQNWARLDQNERAKAIANAFAGVAPVVPAP
jgi:hypothetical protein